MVSLPRWPVRTFRAMREQRCAGRTQCATWRSGGTRTVADVGGGRTRTRTLDPLIKSQLLYQLSYAPAQGARL